MKLVDCTNYTEYLNKILNDAKGIPKTMHSVLRLLMIDSFQKGAESQLMDCERQLLEFLKK